MKLSKALQIASTAMYILLPAGAMSNDEEIDVNRAAHYEAPLPKSAEEAYESLVSVTEKVKALLKEGNLEEIHEQSYSLEAAVDVLISKWPEQEEALAEISDAVAVIHFASENEQKEHVEMKLPELERGISMLKH